MLELTEGTFTATGQSAEIAPPNGQDFTLSILGTFVGTVALQRTRSGGTWRDIETYTAPTEINVEVAGSGFYYRLNCSAYTSGIITYFIG